MFAPYTDTTLWPTFNIADIKLINDFTLGFVVLDKDKDPSWGGWHKVSSSFYSDIISRVKGNLICSFGGASGAEIATKLDTVEDIFAAYDFTISKYNFKFVDFDIEGPAMYNTNANIKRAKAIKKLKEKHKDLHVSLTVPVMPSGLDQDALNLIKITPHDLVNIMAMDFGNEKDMAAAVIKAIESTKKQIKSDLGVTVMIGKNDTPETLWPKDAMKIANYISKNKSWIKRVSFWSIERDQGKNGPLSSSTKIDQKPLEFTKIFKNVY